MSPTLMPDPGSAQLELIRRYARTLRQLHADAMRQRDARTAAREAGRRPAADPLVEAARSLAPELRTDGRTPAAPAS